MSFSLVSNSSTTLDLSSLIGRIDLNSPTSTTEIAKQALSQADQWIKRIPLHAQIQALPTHESATQELKKHSHLQDLPPQSLQDFTALTQDQGIDEIRMLGQILGDHFLAGTSYEGASLSLTARYMLHALETLQNDKVNFSIEEIEKLSQAKHFFIHLIALNEKIEAVAQPSDLVKLADDLVKQIENLGAGDSLFIPGGTTRDAMIYEFQKQHNGKYSFTLYNTGNPEYHNQSAVGNRYMLKPIVEYANLPDEEIFVYSKDSPKGFFIQALLEPRASKDNGLDTEYLYTKLLERLEIYRVGTPDQDLSGFITAQCARTNSWKVMAFGLRIRLSKTVYKKTLLAIKGHKLLESWKMARHFVEMDNSHCSLLREILRKSTQQYCHNLAKAYAKLGTSQEVHSSEWLHRQVATAVDILDHITQHEAQIFAARRNRSQEVQFPSLELNEYDQRAQLIAAINVRNQRPLLLADSYTIPAMPSLSNPQTLAQELKNSYKQLNDLKNNQKISLSAVRAHVDALASLLPVPLHSGKDPFWDTVEDSNSCANLLTQLAEFYAMTAPAKEQSSYSITLTLMTFYSCVHKLTVRLENDLISTLKGSGQNGTAIFQQFPIFNPAEHLAKDRYLFTVDFAALERLGQILGYINGWNANFNNSLKLFDFTQIQPLTELSATIVPDFKLYEQWIRDFGLEDDLNSTSDFASMKEMKVSDRLKRISVLHKTLEWRNSSGSFNDCYYLNSIKRMVMVAHHFSGCCESRNFSFLSFNKYWSSWISSPSEGMSGITFTYYANGRLSDKGIGNLTKEMLPPLNDLTTNFFEKRLTNTRIKTDMKYPVSEAMALASPLIAEGMEGILLHSLGRSAAEQHLQPAQILYAFRRQMSDLGGQDNSRDLQVLLILMFFKVMTGSGKPNEPLLESSAIDQLVKQESLRQQAHEFVEQGLSIFWHQQPGNRPLLDACLFLIQFSQRVRQCLKDTPNEKAFMTGLEERTLDVWLKMDTLTKPEKGNIHLHRMHGFCSRSYNELQSHEVEVLAASWSYFSHNPSPVETQWPDLLQTVENYYFNWLTQTRDLTFGPMMQKVCTSILRGQGYQVPQGNYQWRAKDAHPIYRITVQVAPNRFGMMDDSIFWQINLASGIISTQDGPLADCKPPKWVDSPAFKRFFGTQKHQYTKAGNYTYFVDPKMGQMRVYSYYSFGDYSELEEGLEWNHKGSWHRYIKMNSFGNTVPQSLLYATHLWKDPNGLTTGKSAVISNRAGDTHREIGFINQAGRILIQEASALEGALENDHDLEIRNYNPQRNGTYCLTLVEDPDYIEQRFHNDRFVQLAFPRYCSNSNQPLVFDVLGKEIRWRHHTNFYLSPKQIKGLLPAINNYLILVDKSGREMKIIVPCQQLKSPEELCPEATKGLQVSNSQPYGKVNENEEHVEKTPLRSYQYLEYGVKTDGTLSANKVDELLFLSYLYLQERKYTVALSYLNKIEKVDQLSPLCLNILDWISTLSLVNRDTSPNALAVQLHAFHKLWIHKKKALDKEINQQERDERESAEYQLKMTFKQSQKIYEVYLFNIDEVDKSVELSEEQELTIIDWIMQEMLQEPLREDAHFGERILRRIENAQKWLYKFLEMDGVSRVIKNRASFLCQDFGNDTYPNPKIDSVQPFIYTPAVSLDGGWYIHLPDEDYLLESYSQLKCIPRGPIQENPEILWPSSKREDYFFWKNLKVALQGTREQKQGLLLKLQLTTSSYSDEAALLRFLLIAPEKMLNQISPFPRDTASLREKANWFEALTKLFEKSKYSAHSSIWTTLAGVPKMLSDLFNAFYLNRYQLRPSTNEKMGRLKVVRMPRAYEVESLKNAPWNLLKSHQNLPALQLGALAELPQVRFCLFDSFFNERAGSNTNNGYQFSLGYDVSGAPKEEYPYRHAIFKEYADFLVDLQVGATQVKNQKQWDLQHSDGIRLLETELEKRRQELSITLTALEKDILNLANAKSADSIKQVGELLHDYAGINTPLVLSDLVYLFLKRSKELFEAANPLLKTFKVEGQEPTIVLYQMIGHYLWFATEINTLKRAESLCAKIQGHEDALAVEYHIQLLAQELSAQRHYNPSNRPEFLVFEYCSNLLIRKKQVDLLEHMLRENNGRYVDSVIQLIMGGGKTSVLASLLCHLAAKPGRLSLFITPASQFETVKENLKHTQRRCFNQSLLALDFQRSDLKVPYLEMMQADLKQAIEKGELTLMKVECLQMLELEFISTVRSASRQTVLDEEIKRKCLLLRSILLIFRKQADALFDEVDLVLNTMVTVNFPDGDCIHVPPEHIELMREIYSVLASDQVKVVKDDVSVSLKNFVRLQSNQQTLVNPKDIQGLIAPAVAAHLAEHYAPLKMKESRESFVRFVSGQMNPELEKWVTKPIPKGVLAKMTEQEKEDLHFLNDLRAMNDSDSPDEVNAAKLASLTKHAMEVLLPVTFGKCGGRNYGRTRSTPSGKAVPYLAVDTPATTEFGYHYEALAYQFQTALQFGISREQIRLLASTLRSAAEHYVQKNTAVNFDGTPEAKEFKELTGIELSAINDAGNLTRAVENIQADVAAGNIEKLMHIEAETAVEVVTLHPERIESTAQSVLYQVSTRRGYAGIIWNKDGYDPKFSDAALNDLGTEGQIAHTLLERMAKDELPIHTAQTKDPEKMLETIMQGHPHQERIRGFMDAGGIFKETDNETVARSMLKVLKRQNPQLKGILFFCRAGKATADTLALLKQDAKELIEIDGTSYEEIVKTGIVVEDYFVYYDDRHTTGTDILQVPSAINMVTIDETLMRRGLFQSVLRLRQFFFNQTVEFVIPEESKKALVGNGETFEGILESTIKHQAIHLSKYLYRSYKQMIDNVYYQKSLEQLYSYSFEQCRELILQLEPFLVGSVLNDPYLAFGKLEAEIPTVDALTSYNKRYRELWKRQGLTLTPKLQRDGEEIVERAKKSRILQATVQESGMESIGVEQEVSVQVQQEVQQEVEQELEQELQNELQLYEAVKGGANRPEKSWKSSDWEHLIRSLRQNQGRIDDLPSPVKPLDEYMAPRNQAAFKYNKDYPSLFNYLLSTEAFVWSKENQLPVFHKDHRPADQILIVQSQTRYNALLLSSYEADLFTVWMREKQQTNMAKNVWLVQPDGKLLVDSPFMLPGDELIRDLLLAVNVFNGNIDYLDRNPEDTQRWLDEEISDSEDPKELGTKIAYLKLKSERNPKLRRILQNNEILSPQGNERDYQHVVHISRIKHNRMRQMKPEMITALTDPKALHELRDDQVHCVTPGQVPLLKREQYRFLTSTEQLAAIPDESFNMNAIAVSQVCLLNPTQVPKIRHEMTKLHALSQAQVNLIHPDEINNLLPVQIGWLTDQSLLQQVKGHQITHVNPEEVNQLLDEQLLELTSEQIQQLPVERFKTLHDKGLLNPSLLIEISPEQIAQITDAELLKLIELLKGNIEKLTPEQVTLLPKLNYLVSKHLSEACLALLKRLQVQQFHPTQLHRLPSDKVKDLSVSQVSQIDPDFVEVIQALASTQLQHLRTECLGALKADQVKTIQTQEEIARLPESKLGDLSAEQVGAISNFEVIKRMPGSRLTDLGVVTIFKIPFSSVSELDPAKTRHCSFFQKLVLSVHHLAIGIFTLLPRLVGLILSMPIVILGYSIRERWNSFVLSLAHLKWSVTIWLPPAAA